MGGAEGVVLALAATREAGSPSAHAYAADSLAVAGESLVRIGLVSPVPDDAVVRRVEDVVQRDGQLDRPQIGGQVAAGLADRFENERAQLFGEPLQSPAVQGTPRRRIVDGLQQLVSPWIVSRRSRHRAFAGKIRRSNRLHSGEFARKLAMLV